MNIKLSHSSDLYFQFYYDNRKNQIKIISLYII